MKVIDLVHAFAQDVMPLAVPLCAVVAAAFLWHRTRRRSALIQLVASVLILYGIAVDRYGRHSTGLDAYLSEPMRISVDIALFVGFVLFPIGYICFAVTHKRI